MIVLLHLIILFILLDKCNLDVVANVAPVLAMAVTHAEHVHLREALDVWLEYVGILIDLVWIVRMEADPGGERELSYNIFPFHSRLLRRMWQVNLVRR